MRQFYATLCALLTLNAVPAFAAAPQLINYQGRLTNAGGTPVADANYSVVFTIYDAASGGTSKWTETQSVTTLSGLFAVLLGSVNPVTDSVFNATTRYLGVKVGTDPELTPRMRLVSVPYADRVNTVDGSTGGSLTGNLHLDTSTTTTGNVYKGGTLFLHNGGGYANTCLGINAGNLTMTGDRNTAIGLESMRDNTTGQQNTAVGAGTLTLSTSGNFNTVIGFGALYKNTSDENSAYGVFTLYNNTTGSQNTGLGTYALYVNSTGDSNTACGYRALYNNTIGAKNTATGALALQSNTTGNSNTANGFFALNSNTTGNNNTSCGEMSLFSNTSGSYNTALGDLALSELVSGEGNTAVGRAALYGRTSGQNNTGVGMDALGGVTSGNGNSAFGYQATVADGANNSTAMGNGAFVPQSNMIRLGNSSVTKIEGQVAYTFTSDRNQKENFEPVDGDEVLRKIRGLSLTSWNYKNNDPKQFRHYGPVAQEFYAAFGHDSVGTCGDSIGINSGDMAGITLIAVQTLEREKVQLKETVESIQTENAELKDRLARVEAALNKLISEETGKNLQLGSK